MKQADLDRNEIIEMARQSGIHYRKFFDEFATANTDGVKIEQMEEFARLVAEKAFKDGYAIGEAAGFKEGVKLERKAWCEA